MTKAYKQGVTDGAIAAANPRYVPEGYGDDPEKHLLANSRDHKSLAKFLGIRGAITDFDGELQYEARAALDEYARGYRDGLGKP